MSDDLVTRLRTFPMEANAAFTLVYEAADEIERLRALLTDMWRVVNEPVSDEFYVEVQARYAAALREGK